MSADDFSDAHEQYPSLSWLAQPPGKATKRAWVAAFTDRPQALEDLLSDLIKQAHAVPGRIGQRPMPKEEDVNLQALIYGDYTEEPLTDILPKLMKVSERSFCDQLKVSRRTFQRLLSGDYDPDMELIRRIAALVNKPPSFFVEYRLMAAQAAFIQLIVERPGIATRLYRDHLTVHKSTPQVPKR